MALLPLNESHATNLYNGIQTSKWNGSKIDAGYVRWWNERSANNELESSFELKFDLSNHISGKFPANFMYNIYDTVVRKIFSCGYGSFRILSGRNDTFFQSGYRSKFRTLFSEEEGLPRTQEWLKDLQLDIESKPEKQGELQFVINFINKSELLPDGATLTNKIDSQGIKIKDAAGNEVYFRDASDGYRSILSLTLDLIKNMIAHYGIEKVKENATANQINLPGVVLIDEVDAHLHPNWQVRIGKWFTDFFPQIQFIVTTHSPLICRGCGENGQIWHLKTPGSEEKSGPVSELQRKRLVFGDILDAYDTGVFGPNQSSENSVELRERMAALNMKSIRGAISEDERKELQELQSFL